MNKNIINATFIRKVENVHVSTCTKNFVSMLSVCVA